MSVLTRKARLVEDQPPVEDLMRLLEPVEMTDPPEDPQPQPVNNGKCCNDALVCSCNVRTCTCTCDGCWCN